MEREYHKSVLLQESIEILNIKPDGIYVDLTFGGGGHSRAILDKLNENGRLIAFDQDSHAAENAIDDPRFMLVNSNFEKARDYLIAIGVGGIDGVLADLGVSSFQLDNDDSGFSYRDNINLDMRMNQDDTTLKASDILNTYSLDQLQQIFQNYGEVRNAKTLAQRIIEYRETEKFTVSNQLNEVIEKVKFGPFPSYAAPIYQALRMEVNREMEVLGNMLTSIVDVINVDGVLAIITFHSLEDRMVKNFMKYGTLEGVPPTDMFGKRPEWHWEVITKKPITASEEELKQNPRSRSAKLRAMKRKK